MLPSPVGSHHRIQVIGSAFFPAPSVRLGVLGDSFVGAGSLFCGSFELGGVSLGFSAGAEGRGDSLTTLVSCFGRDASLRGDPFEFTCSTGGSLRRMGSAGGFVPVDGAEFSVLTGESTGFGIDARSLDGDGRSKIPVGFCVSAPPPSIDITGISRRLRPPRIRVVCSSLSSGSLPDLLTVPTRACAALTSRVGRSATISLSRRGRTSSRFGSWGASFGCAAITVSATSRGSRLIARPPLPNSFASTPTTPMGGTRSIGIRPPVPFSAATVTPGRGGNEGGPTRSSRRLFRRL